MIGEIISIIDRQRRGQLYQPPRRGPPMRTRVRVRPTGTLNTFGKLVVTNPVQFGQKMPGCTNTRAGLGYNPCQLTKATDKSVANATGNQSLETYFLLKSETLSDGSRNRCRISPTRLRTGRSTRPLSAAHVPNSIWRSSSSRRTSGRRAGVPFSQNLSQRRSTAESSSAGSKPMTETRRYRDEDWLREQYLDEKKSSLHIAEACSVSAATVCRWLNRHDIPIRSDSEQVENYDDPEGWKNKMADTKTDGRSATLRDKSWLREKYVDENLSTYEIADVVGVTRPTVCNWLRRHEIEIEDPGARNRGDVESLKDADWLREQYDDLERTSVDIADELDVDHKTVRRYLRKHAIPIRDMVGENHPMWNGGYDGYYGTSWPTQRQKALLRDQYRCQECGITDAEHRESNSRGLHVHHIMPYREFDTDREAHRLENLLAVCTACHSRIEPRSEEVDGR